MLGCASDELYARFPQLPEGKLTQLRARLVREESLVEVARRLGLQPELRTGTVKDSVLADCLKPSSARSVDSGYAAARNAVVHAFGPLLDSLDPSNVEKDLKTPAGAAARARQAGSAIPGRRHPRGTPRARSRWNAS